MTTHPPTENAQEIKRRLIDADLRGVSPPQNWTSEAVAYMESLEHQLAEAIMDAAILKRVQHELLTYSPAADEYKGAHIHKYWAAEIGKAMKESKQ